MEITCKLIKIQDDNIQNLQGEVYLSIETSKNDKPIYIKYDKFRDIYIGAKEKTDNLLSEISVASGFTPLRKKEGQKKSRFNQVINFLSEEININEVDFNNENDEIIVRSDIGMFLELPWESIVRKRIFVIRKFISNKKNNFEKDANNLLLFMSHACEGVGANLQEKMNEEIKSIYNTLHFLRENNQASFRINQILLSKHTTKEVLEKTHWKDFNFVHFIMHGDSNGNLYLEMPDKENYKQPDNMSILKLLKTLDGNHFTLIFLSICYSGGEVDNENSLALQLIEANYSQYVIGYSNTVGDISAKSFTEIFYEFLITGENIQTVYKESLKRYYKINEQTKYMPLLYMC